METDWLILLADRPKHRYGVGLSVRAVIAAIIVFVLFAGEFGHAENSPAGKPLTVPPMQFKHSTLPNGLEVYSVADNASPTVAVQVWYHVGSKDDPAGRSGFAHLFEHMMFKGNEHLTADTFDQLTESIGGEN